MTREQQLKYCKVCSNRSFHAQYGIVCGITNLPANFDPTCPDFRLQVGASPVDAAQLAGNNPFDAETSMATTGQRFANHIIDTIIIYILCFVSVILFAFSMAVIAPESLADIDEESSGFTLITYLWVAIAMICYYWFMESIFGRTIGKMITGTRVVTKTGAKPSAYTILLRSLLRLVPFEAFSFLGSLPRGWHDSWTDTWVVENKKNR